VAPTQRPRKRFGQHFLRDRGVLARIVAAIAPRVEDHLVEIGPGHGVLTAALVQRVAMLDAIEIDRDLSAALAARYAAQQRLRVHTADALTFEYSQLATHDRLRVVGNLPYNISTPLLFHLLEQRASVIDMHFMLQREVVERMSATPGTRAWGRLGAMIQYYCEVEALFDVCPGAFRPAPRVHSAVVRLRVRAHPAVTAVSEDHLKRLIAKLFTQRRKTVRNGLRGLIDASAIRAAGVDPRVRPERLSLAEFARLADSWAATATRGAPRA